MRDILIPAQRTNNLDEGGDGGSKNPADSGADRARRKGDFGTETILLVEDKSATRERLASALAGKGYSVFTAANGVEGVELFRSFQKYVDLVIIDHGLPRLSGKEAAQQIKNISSDVKVILMTADPASDMTDEMRECGIDEILVKPFTMKSAMKTIRTIFSKSTM